jgi:hypothetical protein
MNLKYKNLFHYLLDAGIYHEDHLEDLKIDLSSQASNWLIGSGAEVRFFAFLILMHKGLYRIASLLLQDYRLIELPRNLGKVFVKQTPHQSGL